MSAKEGKDYKPIDADRQIITFKDKEEFQIIKVEIIDDEQWNDDREFAVELYNPENNQAFPDRDATTNILIIDDDKPGNLAFENKKGQVRHVVSDEKCVMTVVRTGGADGKIGCKYTTRPLVKNPRSADEGKDFKMIEGELVFEHN